MIESKEGSLAVNSDDKINIKLADCDYKHYVTESSKSTDLNYLNVDAVRLAAIISELVLESTYMGDTISCVVDEKTGIQLYEELSVLWHSAG